MTNPRLTDEAVGRLPLSRARAELLEDIMATSPLDTVTERSVRRPRRRGTLIAVGSAAAAVAALFAVPALLDATDAPAPEQGAPAVAPPAAPVGERVLLDAPGWAMTYVQEDRNGGEVSFSSGEQTLDINFYRAQSYDSYVDDREHILDPPAPGDPVSLLGTDAQMWAYSRHDHTAMAPVTGKHFVEVRGSGMDKAAYLALLGQLSRVSDEAFDEMAAAAGMVTPGTTRQVIDAMLADIPVPDGWTPRDVDVEGYNSRYQVGAPLTESVTCAWIEVYRSGDAAGAERATAAMAGSRGWDILTEMQKTGAWSPMIWAVGDGMRDAVPGNELVNWVDCDGVGMSGHTP